MNRVMMFVSGWIVGALCLTGVGAAAESAVASMPGYFPLENMEVFEPGQLEVDISLEGPMIQLAVGALEEEAPELAEVVAQIRRIRVQVGPLGDRDRSALEAIFAGAEAQLEKAGWVPMVRVDEDEESVRVFARQTAEVIQGLTVLVNDGFEEAVLLNIVGELDPRMVGRLIASMDGLDDLPDLAVLGVEVAQSD